jgi:hypothetical protein
MAVGVQAADARDPINRVGKESSSSKSIDTYRSIGFRLTSITGLEAEHGQHFPVVPSIPFGRTIAATADHRLLLPPPLSTTASTSALASATGPTAYRRHLQSVA